MSRYMLLDESDGLLKEPAETGRWSPYPQATTLDLTPATRREILRFISVPWRKLYRRDLVERAGLRFPVGDFFFEDNPFHWMAVIEAERIALVPERLCEHRVARAGHTWPPWTNGCCASCGTVTSSATGSTAPPTGARSIRVSGEMIRAMVNLARCTVRPGRSTALRARLA